MISYRLMLDINSFHFAYQIDKIQWKVQLNFFTLVKPFNWLLLPLIYLIDIYRM